ncbi:MAG: PIG-L family deacetylase [Cytophagales bacterium]|nr:PIG-L family deacetylase [Cytophagales bacterium]
MLRYLMLFFACNISMAQYSSTDILQNLQKLTCTGTVLYIAAHPDDENNELLSWLANEKMLRTGYLSLTRGDGGQNLIGKEQRELLGIIRTQELLEARRIDGAEQFFTRAVDFGYSKNPTETFNIWNKNAVLSDVVRVIRQFRPDVIICRFPTDGRGGHGHHTASAIVAEEAYEAAADASKFPAQLAYLKPWKTQRLLFNAFGWNRNGASTQKGEILLDVGQYNPITGKSYAETAAESRSMHRSQGFGSGKSRGESWEFFTVLKGNKDTTQMFPGIDFSWGRVEEGKNIETILYKAIKEYNPLQPHAIVPYLLQAYDLINKISDETLKNYKKMQIQNLVIACTGFYAEALSQSPSATQGDVVNVQVQYILRNKNVPVVIKKISFGDIADTTLNNQAPFNIQISVNKKIKIKNMPNTTPYWMEKKPTLGLFVIPDSSMIGKAESEPALPAKLELEIKGVNFTHTVPVIYKWVEKAEGEKSKPFVVVPTINIRFADKVYMIGKNGTHSVAVQAFTTRDSTTTDISLTLPTGWQCMPNNINASFTKKNVEQIFVFNVKPARNADAKTIISASATMQGATYNTYFQTITYSHIKPQTYILQAEAYLLSTQILTKSTKIGYIEGAGDDIPAALQKIGCTVHVLNNEILNTEIFDKYDAIVTGVRAYNVNDNLKKMQSKLLKYVENGGTLIVQYNTVNWAAPQLAKEIGPYPFTISGARVTDENAPVKFLSPTHPLLNMPNVLTDKDFEGWVQERGLYFANEYDSRYVEILEMNDQGDKPLKGSLIVAKYGKGYFVYTGLSFFRQMPAGVPGAYKLFANIISLGK